MYSKHHLLFAAAVTLTVGFGARADEPAAAPSASDAPVVAEPTPTPTVAPVVSSPAVSAPSASPQSPTPTSTTSVTTHAETVSKPAPYRGSTITYGHNATAYTFVPSAEPYYNPTWSHRLGILPEWHFNDQFVARGRIFLNQELTQSDTTTYSHEVEFTDTWLDFAANGITEKFTKVKLGGDVRFGLPTSKAAHAATRLLTIGPSANISRKFDVLHGLSLNYVARFTYRFHRLTTAQNDGTGIDACSPIECPALLSAGTRNPNFDLLHGLSVSFNPLEKLSFDASLLLQHIWLYPLAPVTGGAAGSTGLTAQGSDTRALSIFIFSAGYQITKPVNLSLGLYTWSGQPGADGQYLFPLINRSTALFLEAGFDIEAAAKSLL